MSNSTMPSGSSRSEPRIPSLGFEPPALPQSVSYHDEYEDATYTIRELESPQWTVSVYGSKRTMDFTHLAAVPDLMQLVKVFIAQSLAEWAPSSVVDVHLGLRTVDTAEVSELLSGAPRDAMLFWESRVINRWPYKACHAAKALLRLLCERWLGPWTPHHIAFVESAFPWPKRDKYVTVRDGTVFLEVSEEAEVVRWLDKQVARVDSLTAEEARDACMVACCYQLGTRPMQLALLRRSDVAIRPRLVGGGHFVHFRFQKIKQNRKKARREVLVRSLTTEWTPLFVRFFTLEQLQGDAHNPLFAFESASALVVALNQTIQSILGPARTSYSLRHTAAQRMVDAGASLEEVADFLGHSALTTSLIYFGASANGAERLNKALGVSEVYGAIERIASDRFISEEDLRRLKGDNQIAGMPHGIPISSIGECGLGQPNCPFNPVMACYNCDKHFRPVDDIGVHRDVLADLRSIVITFKDASRGDGHSPAFMQLTRAIRGCQTVIASLPDAESTAAPA